jgi:hypothetical protein
MTEQTPFNSEAFTTASLLQLTRDYDLWIVA